MDMRGFTRAEEETTPHIHAGLRLGFEGSLVQLARFGGGV